MLSLLNVQKIVCGGDIQMNDLHSPTQALQKCPESIYSFGEKSRDFIARVQISTVKETHHLLFLVQCKCAYYLNKKYVVFSFLV